jgi:hypothetical protein
MGESISQRCNVLLTCVTNFILNDKILSFDSTLGTFIISKKNFSNTKENQQCIDSGINCTFYDAWNGLTNEGHISQR